MRDVSSLHNDAMEMADLGSAAQRTGDRELAEQYFRKACELESEAAKSVPRSLMSEPTRSILFRSAATLALRCGLVEAAASLVREGLDGSPPATVAEELRSLIDSGQLQSLVSANGRTALHDFFETNEWTINHSISLPARGAHFLNPSELALSNAVERYCRSQFPTGLYAHQVAALKAFVSGHDVCLSTGTASGKSMVFYAATMEFLAQNPRAKALLVYPLKALGREQETRIIQATRSAGLDFAVGRIDGQVPVASRAGIIRRSRILILTPDIIHAWLLSSMSEPAVAGFLRNLGLVIVDEVHNYTGVFGSNAAFLFRRLRHIVNLLGRRLSYICASATIANPASHLRHLLGADFTIVGPEADSSSRHRVDLLLVTPPRVKDLLSEMTELFKFLSASEQHRFIAFVDSRKQVEYLSAILRRGDDDETSRFQGDHLESMQVLPFRSGYELEDRNKIQDRLTSGRVKGVVSTSALELGIDIPYLDTGVLVGVPLSLTSLLQRIGRIGRHKPGTVIVVNRGEIQDQQAFKDAEAFMSRPLTESSLYLENQRIQYLNALCLARTGGEHDTIMGNESSTATDFASPIEWPPGFVDLCRKERIGEISTDLQSMKMEGGDDPNHVFPLRDVEAQFHVEMKQGPEQRSLGTLSHSQVLREAYPGAVYYYTGQPFRVYRVFQQSKRIQARPESRYTTKPIVLPTLVFPNLSLGNVHRAARLGDLVITECNLQIREVIVGFKERRGSNEFTVQYPISSLEGGIRFDLPRFTRNYFTTGVVFTHPALSRQGVRGDICADLLYEAFISLIPFERQDVGSASDRHRADRVWVNTGQVFLALHDQTYGSLRLSGRVLDGDCLSGVLKRMAELSETSGIQESEPFTANALKEISEAGNLTSEGISFDGPMPTSGAAKIRVIMPGSRGINLRRNNEEFEVTRIFFSPALQAVAYRGRHLGTSIEDVAEIVAVDWVEPTPGESVIGYYDPETGDLEEIGVVG